VSDKITYSATISACKKGGQWQLALHLLNLMPEARVVPNEITYNAAIRACECGAERDHLQHRHQCLRKGGQWQLALSLLSLMPEARVVPNEITYSATISA
jgi:pentatricopeptide repeat domain-containing protein 1